MLWCFTGIGKLRMMMIRFLLMRMMMLRRFMVGDAGMLHIAVIPHRPVVRDLVDRLHFPFEAWRYVVALFHPPLQLLQFDNGGIVMPTVLGSCRHTFFQLFLPIGIGRQFFM